MKHPRLVAALVAAAGLPALAACTSNSTTSSSDGSGSGSRTITVTSSDDACELSADTAPAGNVVYKVKNTGNKVTEFYLYAEDGKRIVGEVENVGPGLSRSLVVNMAAGSYVPACKPGMTGEGIRSTFTVTPSKDASGTASGTAQKQVDAANEQYHEYVEDQSAELLAATRQFVAAYKSGDDTEARRLYPTARVHWERIEPVAESFGDLDPKMDAREADLAQGQRWTGWHRIEKDLWPPAGYRALSDRQRAAYADGLLDDTRTLAERAGRLTFTVDQIGNGAKSLLDEVATGKVTGEEEIWSHTDLYDFQANVDGARFAFEGLEPVLEQRDPALAKQTEVRFTALQSLLDRHRVGKDGFVGYDTLSRAEVKQLSDAVNALSEPLSRLTAAVAL